VAPLYGAAAAHHHTCAASGEFYFSKAAPVGNNGETVNDLNQGSVIGCEW
jgi:hypothetical protein